MIIIITCDEIYNNNSFSDLLVEELLESEIENIWWDNKLELDNINFKEKKKKTNKSQAVRNEKN